MNATSSAIVLQPLDLAAAALLLLACAAASIALALRVHRPMLIATARMIGQLLLVGLILNKVLALSSGWLTALVVAVMLVAATQAVHARQRHGLAGRWAIGASAAVVGTITMGVTLLALATALRPDPWHDPRHLIPLTGIVLGAVMNAASLSLHDLFESLRRERASIEARLALGHSHRQAFSHVAQRAVMTGILPTLNQMTAAGIITLPGIMTGQILAGMEPLQAAKYQILLMLLLASGSALAAMAAVRLAIWRLSDTRARLRWDRLRG